MLSHFYIIFTALAPAKRQKIISKLEIKKKKNETLNEMRTSIIKNALYNKFDEIYYTNNILLKKNPTTYEYSNVTASNTPGLSTLNVHLVILMHVVFLKVTVALVSSPYSTSSGT